MEGSRWLLPVVLSGECTTFIISLLFVPEKDVTCHPLNVAHCSHTLRNGPLQRAVKAFLAYKKNGRKCSGPLMGCCPNNQPISPTYSWPNLNFHVIIPLCQPLWLFWPKLKPNPFNCFIQHLIKASVNMPNSRLRPGSSWLWANPRGDRQVVIFFFFLQPASMWSKAPLLPIEIHLRGFKLTWFLVSLTYNYKDNKWAKKQLWSSLEASL